MLIILILLIVICLSVYELKFHLKKWTIKNSTRWVSTCGILTLSGAILIGAIFIAVTNRVTMNADTAGYVERQYSLQYQLANDDYIFDKYKLYAEIERWNVDLARKRELKKSLWIGIFYPIDYNRFDIIQLPTYYG